MPRNSISFTFYWYFSGLTNKLFSSSLFNTSSTSLLCFSSVSVVTIILSMNVAVSPWLIISQNRLFIIVWKVAREFVSLKYMTVSSYVLMCIVNAIFYLLPFLILISLYLYLRLGFVNTFFFPTLSRISAIRGRRYPFFTIH